VREVADLLRLDQGLGEEVGDVVAGLLLVVQVLDFFDEHLVVLLQTAHDLLVLGLLRGQFVKRVGLVHPLQVDDPHVQVEALILPLELDGPCAQLAAFLQLEDVNELVLDLDEDVHELVKLDLFLQD